MMKRYQSRVQTQCYRNPCLSGLCQFLAIPNSQQKSCRITCLEFRQGAAHPLHRSLGLSELHTVVSTDAAEGKEEVYGQLIIVEDVSPDAIEMLGSSLSIDPMFFASHVNAPIRDISTQTPDLATLPSRRQRENFVHIQYHRTVVLQKRLGSSAKQLRDTNVKRKVVELPPIRGTSIGLVQHGCSVLKKSRRRKDWLCMMTYLLGNDDHCSLTPCLALVLVDAPIENDQIPIRDEQAEPAYFSLPVKLFQGGYEDFLEPLEEDVSIGIDVSALGPSRQGLLKDLIYYWQRKLPDSFNSENPSLLSVALYPLKIVAAEWMNYVAVMNYSIKRYEYTIENLSTLFKEPDYLNSDLRDLQTWRRRSLSSQHKLSLVRRFVDFHQIEEVEPEDSTMVLEDYIYITEKIKDYAERLESMLPVVTSMVQIVDSRRSFAETANVSRLTYLALVFVPLTFTSGLFGMNTDIAPGGKKFWIYFAVAVPVTVIVFVLAQPPASELRRLYIYLRSSRKPQVLV